MSSRLNDLTIQVKHGWVIKSHCFTRMWLLTHVLIQWWVIISVPHEAADVEKMKWGEIISKDEGTWGDPVGALFLHILYASVI